MRALDAEAYARQGVWTDWDRGASIGLTLSLSQQNAAILVAALALFIQMAGNRLWIILRFLIHQRRVKTTAQPGFYHQQQALLRNSGSSSGFLFELMFVASRWRKSIGNSIGSFSVLSISALVHLGSLLTLGILSSKLIKVEDKALISSPYCIINPNDTDFLSSPDLAVYGDWSTNIYGQAQDSVKYADSCYITASTEGAACSKHAVPRIDFGNSNNVTCPFDDKVCHKQAFASKFDTGLFDVGRTLGFNLNSAIFARKLLTCMPLNDTAYTKINDLKSSHGLNVTSAYYGNQFSITITNSTYSSTDVFDDMTIDQQGYFRAYGMASKRSYYIPDGVAVDDVSRMQTFNPIPELSSRSGDLSLNFLTFPGYYNSPNNDLWFSAHRKTQMMFNSSTNSTKYTVYRKDLPISTLACLDQYQVCHNGNNNCTSLSGVLQLAAEVNNWKMTDAQAKAMYWLLQIFITTGASNFITKGGNVPPLLANQKYYGQISMPLPVGQWRREVEYWFSISLAWMQQQVVDYGTGQLFDNVTRINTTMTSPQRDFCDNIIVRGTKLQSSSLFAIILIFVVGSLIIALSWCIESLCEKIPKRRNRRLANKIMWDANGLLQLQRLVYEARSEGTWTGAEKDIPVTRPGEKLEFFQISTAVAPRIITREILAETDTNCSKDSSSKYSLVREME